MEPYNGKSVQQQVASITLRPLTVNWLPIDWVITFPFPPSISATIFSSELRPVRYFPLYHPLLLILYMLNHISDLFLKMFPQKMLAVNIIRQQLLICAVAIIGLVNISLELF